MAKGGMFSLYKLSLPLSLCVVVFNQGQTSKNGLLLRNHITQHWKTHLIQSDSGFSGFTKSLLLYKNTQRRAVSETPRQF